MKRLSCLLSLLFTVTAYANVQLPGIFTDSMVLQREHAIPVWGWAGKNEKITVQFHQQTKTVKADKNGQWKINLDAEQAGGPFTLTITGKNNIVLNNILVGDVWVCSGQSNMEFAVNGVLGADKEKQEAHYNEVRHFYLPKEIAASPKQDVLPGSSWKAATPANVGDFTAVGYFFARELNQQLHIPIGLIHTSWGGTQVEAWISKQGFESSNTFKDDIAKLPVLNLDSLSGIQKAKMEKMAVDLQGGFPDAAAVKSWMEMTFNDKSWPAMKLPGLWELQQLKDFDGVVWFRKHINVKAADAGKTATLSLALVDDSDEGYLNGKKIGGLKNQYNTKRVYQVPAGLLKEGDNIILVRVEDTGGGGGIFGEATDMSLKIDGGETQSLAGDWLFQVASASNSAVSIGPNSYPSLLYNAMVNPIIPFAIKGAIWYQGESNAGRAYQYRTSFPLMIADWRNKWQQGDFPFYFVQLASFEASHGDSKSGSSWAELREAQTLTQKVPNTGMAVITDIGETHDIHPRNKQDVGKRLAAIALHDTYGKQLEFQGPVYQSMQVQGNKAVLNFTHADNGFVIKDKYGYIRGFEVAGADKQFHYAKAVIENGHIVVYTDEVASPVAVRYSWSDDPFESNLFNKEGFPAQPFRTDEWPGITEKSKYEVHF